ncbi:glycosyltransferase family 9 protein [Sulfurimonas sp.]|uniref:glycosyltransferase family 9 protein n=1 Tax=Sulfurimonas sp. TaxID=2022749 RepID=UPI003566C431
MRVLVTRHDKIGDFITSLPMCKILKDQTEHEVVMLVSKINYDLASKLDFVDDVIEYTDDILELSKRIKAKNIDVSISGYIENKLGIALILAGVKKRIGPATKIAQIFFNDTLKQRRSEVKKTEWQYNLDLVKHFDESLKLEFKRPLLDTKQKRENMVVFHAGSGGSSDGNLSWDDYIKLAKAASQKAEVVFTFGPDDSEVKEYIKTHLDFDAKIRDDFKSIWDLTEFISTSKMFTSTSTGPMHLAGLTNTPTLSFFGANLFASAKRWSTISDIEIQNNFEVPAEYSIELYKTIEDTLLSKIS